MPIIRMRTVRRFPTLMTSRNVLLSPFVVTVQPARRSVNDDLCTVGRRCQIRGLHGNFTVERATPLTVESVVHRVSYLYLVIPISASTIHTLRWRGALARAHIHVPLYKPQGGCCTAEGVEIEKKK